MHNEKQDPLEFEENVGTIGYVGAKFKKARDTATKRFTKNKLTTFTANTADKKNSLVLNN